MPTTITTIKTLYVFVEIAIDSQHLVQTIRLNFPTDRREFHQALLELEETDRLIPAGQPIGPGQHLRIESPSDAVTLRAPSQNTADTTSPPPPEERTRLALVSTIQFVAALSRLKDDLATGLADDDESGSKSHTNGANGDLAVTRPKLHTGKYEASIPRSKPLSPGEILGCTSPHLSDEVDAILYVGLHLSGSLVLIYRLRSYLGDGRFHLESIMISNPSIPAFRYDPYSKKLTRERYDHREMRSIRDEAVQTARRSIDVFAPRTPVAELVSYEKTEIPLWGVILGTLGRQGSFKQLQAITHQLSGARNSIPYMPILLSELSPAKLALFNPHISTFVQTSCPRLSIDWGYAFEKPLLSPYETAVAVGKAVGWTEPSVDSSGKQQEARYPMDFYAAGTPWSFSRAKAEYPAEWMQVSPNLFQCSRSKAGLTPLIQA